MKEYITLTTHKKCIGQYNFLPLLYWKYLDNSNILSGIYGYYLPNPGTYTIKYVSGGIKTHNLQKINQFLPSSKYLKLDSLLHWNQYYETSALALGNYDISYFPTSSILFGCFQCQFGTLPGFSDTGFFTKLFTEVFNSIYTPTELTFTIDIPQYLSFWYTDILLQTTEGSITYSIEFQGIGNNLYYFNDISILAIDKNTKNKISYENYVYNKSKENILLNKISKSKKLWVLNTSAALDIKTLVLFNTVGYNAAYLNDIKYTDTANYNKVYSTEYHWELLKLNENKKYIFIGKFNKQSATLLLYRNSYTMIINKPAYYINTLIFSPKADPNKWDNTKIKDNVYQFSINIYDFIDFNTILNDNIEIYLYTGYVTLNELTNYIQLIKSLLNSLQNIPVLNTTSADKNYSTVLSFNENIYDYYIDLSLYMENISSVIIYTEKTPTNNTSLGPYADKLTALSSIRNTLAKIYSCSGDNIILSSINENSFINYKYSAIYDFYIKGEK